MPPVPGAFPLDSWFMAFWISAVVGTSSRRDASGHCGISDRTFLSKLDDWLKTVSKCSFQRSRIFFRASGAISLSLAAAINLAVSALAEIWVQSWWQSQFPPAWAGLQVASCRRTCIHHQLLQGVHYSFPSIAIWWWAYDGIPYQVKQRAGDRSSTAENMEKSQHTDFNENRTNDLWQRMAVKFCGLSEKKWRNTSWRLWDERTEKDSEGFVDSKENKWVGS